jgi:hypothetical protein
MASSFQFRNVNTYVVEPEGEPIQSLPSKGSLDFSPQSSCIEEAPDDGNQYARQSKSWQEVVIPANTSDLNNDSGFITDSSLTKENIVGLKLADSPEFADTQITPLAVEATYTPTVWSYLVGLFTTVPKSALQHLIKLWGVVNDLADRVGLLEDKIIAEITITEDVAQVTITVDKNGNPINIINGDSFIVEMEVEYVDAVDNLGRSGWRINDNSGEIYRRSSSVTNYMSSILSNQLYIKSKWMMSLFNRDLNGIIMTIYSADKVSYAASTTNAWTIGLATENISRFDFVVQNTDSFKAGSKFIIKKV